MSLLEYDMLKKIAAGIEKNNELLQHLIEIQQPKTEVVSDKPNQRGRGNGNKK